jgi:hypothetical protein
MSVYGIGPSDLDPRVSSETRIQLTDSVTAPAGVEDTAKTQEVIDNAEVKLHGAAAIYYQVPIAPRGDATIFEAAQLVALTKRMVVQIAAYDLMALKPTFLTSGEESKYWLALNKESSDWLDGLASSKRLTRLAAAQERTVATQFSVGAKAQSDPSMFGRCSMKGFR